MSGLLTPALGELATVSRQFEHASAAEIVQWSFETFGDGLVMAASFQDCVLLDVVAGVAPGVEVVFLDTGFHFAETTWFVDQVRRRYDLNLTVMHPVVEVGDMWQLDVDACCHARKVEPLARALDGKDAWMTAVRRVEAPTRAATPIVTYDIGRNMVKISPLATWTDGDVENYIAANELPVHPLTERGYPSIGCWPCTRPVAPGEDPRSGRWSGMTKTECGLHTPPIG